MNRPKRPRRDFRDSQTFKSVSLLPSSVLDGIFRFAASKPPTCLKPTSEPSLDLKSLIPLSLVCHSWLRPAIRLLWYRRVTDSLESLSALHSALLIKPNSNSRLRDRVQLYRDSISGFEFRTEAAPDPWTDRDRNQSGLRLVTLLAGILDTCSNLSCVSISDFGILLGSGYVVDHDAIFRAISGSCRTLVLDGIEFSATGLSDVFSRLGRLEEFRVRDYDAPMSNKLHLRGLGECVPESLTRLEIALPDSGATISDSAFTMVFGKVDLEVLKLSRCVELKGETLAIGGGKWTGLRVLEVVRSPMVDNEAFEGIKTRKLEVLRLDKVGATWRAVNAVCQLNKKIKELSLSGKMLASLQSLESIRRNLPDLRSLSLSSTPLPPATLCDYLPRFQFSPLLESLSLSQMQISDKLLKTIAESCGSLRKLSLDHSAGYSVPCLIEAAASLKQSEKLSVKGLVCDIEEVGNEVRDKWTESWDRGKSSG